MATQTTAPALAPPWGRHPLPTDETLTVAVGPLLLRARARPDEIWLAHVPGDGTRSGRRAEGPPSGEGEWVRWPVSEAPKEIALAPLFPPRAVVAEPGPAFRLLPRGRARIYVRVPLWARVDAILGDAAARRLTEVPTVVLSDTWWGGVTEGELCYWLATTARRRVPFEVFQPHLVVCPLELSNRSDEELPVEKLVLRVAYLSLFSDQGRLWADETRVRYQGPAAGSEIEVAGTAPPEAPAAVRVAEPRVRAPARGFRALAIARLKALPGLGGL